MSFESTRTTPSDAHEKTKSDTFPVPSEESVHSDRENLVRELAKAEEGALMNRLYQAVLNHLQYGSDDVQGSDDSSLYLWLERVVSHAHYALLHPQGIKNIVEELFDFIKRNQHVPVEFIERQREVLWKEATDLRLAIERLREDIDRPRRHALMQKIHIETEEFFATHSPEAVIDFLENAEIETQDTLGGGRNETIAIKLKNDGWGVVKKATGEEAGLREHIPAGTYYKREIAAYIVDSMLVGFDLVAPTAPRTMDDSEASVQQFVPGARMVTELSFTEREAEMDRMERMKLWIFDYIIHNSDRYSNNILIKDSRIYAIDHGLAFAEKESFLVYEDFFGEELSPEIITLMENVQKRLRDQNFVEKFTKSLEPFLDDDEIASLLRRARSMAYTILQDNCIYPGFDRGRFKAQRRGSKSMRTLQGFVE